MSLEYSFRRKGVYIGFLPVTLHQALATSLFNTKAEQLVAFIFNPGDITFHHITLGPPKSSLIHFICTDEAFVV